MGSSSDTSTTGNVFDISIIFLLVATTFLFERIWMDIFILTVNCRDWMKKKHLSTTDKILSFQGSIRICLGLTMLNWSILMKLCPWIIQIGYVFKVITFSFWYFVSCNLWLTASLCSYYCVKIADFNHPFFIHLKRRLSGLESAWLLGSAILALGSSLPVVYSDLEIQGNSNISQSFQNKTVIDINHTIMALHMHALLELGCFAAFTICAISAALLLFSLWRHRQRMLGSWGGHRSPQTNAHFQALVTILSLLVISVIVFICIQLILSKAPEVRFIPRVVAAIVLYSCFSVESIITIWGNKKLKNELCRSLCFAQCRGCVRKLHKCCT